jgi:hypothetical protein
MVVALGYQHLDDRRLGGQPTFDQPRRAGACTTSSQVRQAYLGRRTTSTRAEPARCRCARRHPRRSGATCRSSGGRSCSSRRPSSRSAAGAPAALSARNLERAAECKCCGRGAATPDNRKLLLNLHAPNSPEHVRNRIGPELSCFGPILRRSRAVGAAEISGNRSGQRHAVQLARRCQSCCDDLSVVELKLGQFDQS